MNFLALLLGLGVERTLTQLFHLREFRWLDPLFDRVFRRLRRAPPGLALAALAALALLLAAPALYASLALSGQLGAFLFAIVMLLFCLGPRDLEQEAAEYCAAAAAGDDEALHDLGRELAEHEPARDAAGRRADVERAVYVQANNRVFGVVFWFLVLGPVAPAGAWLFRVADLMRRRAAFSRPAGAALPAARALHGVLAWLPGRLMAGAFPLAGTFEAAAAAWRRASAGDGVFYERTERLLADVGQAARGPLESAAEGGVGEAALIQSAVGLVRRTLWLIWYPVIALLTLNDWLR